MSFNMNDIFLSFLRPIIPPRGYPLDPKR